MHLYHEKFSLVQKLHSPVLLKVREVLVVTCLRVTYKIIIWKAQGVPQ